MKSRTTTAPGSRRSSLPTNRSDGPETHESRPFQLHLGQLVHAAIGQCLIQAQRTGAEPTIDLSIITRILAADPLRHDRRRGELLLRSYVRCYLENFMLPSPWRLEAVEHRWSDGRIDLLFRNAWTNEVIGDEIKTARGRRGSVDDEDLEQVRRYLRQLHAEFGEHLLGVRLIRLSPPTECRFYRSIEDITGPSDRFDVRAP